MGWGELLEYASYLICNIRGTVGCPYPDKLGESVLRRVKFVGGLCEGIAGILLTTLQGESQGALAGLTK